MRRDDRCEFCGSVTDSVAGNPAMWPLFFTLPDGMGVVRAFHMGCVQDRLFRRSHEHDQQIVDWRSRGKIR
jgi:hypothetical protein